MAVTKGAWVINTIQSLANKVVGQATALKVAFDKAGSDIKTYINSTLTVEIDALDAANVKITGDQNVAGVKTFASSPVVPTPTTDYQAATKKYADDLDTAQTGALTTHKSSNDHDGRYYTETEVNAFAVKLTGNQSVAGIKTFSSSPIVPTPTTATQAASKSYVDDNFVTQSDLTTTRKLSAAGDFTGTLDGAAIVAAEPGLSSIVTAHIADEDVHATADKQTYWNKNGAEITPTVIRSHFGCLRGQGYVDGEGYGTKTVATAVSEGDSTIDVTDSTGYVSNQLIAYLATDGEYYTSRIRSISVNTLILVHPVEADIAAGTNVFSFYANKSHPQLRGYRALADYALRSDISEKKVVVSFKNLYTNRTNYLDAIGSATFAELPTTNVAIPGSPSFHAIQVNTAVTGDGVQTKYFRVKGKTHKFYIPINAGSTGTLNINVVTRAGVTLYTYSGATAGSLVALYEGVFKPRYNDDIQIQITQTGTLSFMQIGSIDVIEISEEKELNGGVHVLLGDSWFANEGISQRLAERLDNATIYEEGTGGDTAAALLVRFDADVTPHLPDYVWIMVGTNDYYAGVTAATYSLNIDKLINKIIEIGAKPIIFESSVGAKVSDGYSEYELTALSRDYWMTTEILEKEYSTTEFETTYPFDVNISTDITSVAGSTTTYEMCLGAFASGTKVEILNKGGVGLSANNYVEFGFAAGITNAYDQSYKLTSDTNTKTTTSITATATRYLVVRRVNATGGALSFGGYLKIKITKP